MLDVSAWLIVKLDSFDCKSIVTEGESFEFENVEEQLDWSLLDKTETALQGINLCWVVEVQFLTPRPDFIDLILEMDHTGWRTFRLLLNRRRTLW